MKSAGCAVHVRGAAFLVALSLATAATNAHAQSEGRGALDQLVQEAAAQVGERFTRPLGRVAERRRDRVFVILRQLPPPPGTVLEVVDATPAQQPERIVARLEVIQSDAGLTECREQERVGRAHAAAGDIVRLPVGTTRLLLAPCVSVAELAPEIPQVIGEKLRTALAGSSLFVLLDDPEAERRAEAAYLASAAADFVGRQENADEVLYPVLLQTPGKMVLNLEYFSVERRRATDIDVVSVALDDLMQAWLRAGRTWRAVPPGFRRLPPQTRAWRVAALGASPTGDLVALDPDSVHVLGFDYPGLRVRYAASLGQRQRRRRDPWCALVGSQDLQAAGIATGAGAAVYLLSDERRPLALVWQSGADAPPQLRPASADLEASLERLWTTLRPQSRRQESRWWPSPVHLASVFVPCFADLDLDGRTDLVWTDDAGLLHVKLGAQRSTRSFSGFGDVKTVQPARAEGVRAVLWLTDPVWHGEPDRLHEAQLAGDDLQLVWSSEPHGGTIAAVASLDLNRDGAADVVAAEALPDGTRLHAYLAFTGERAARAVSQTGEEQR